jgi:hypothetical protein
MIGRNVVGWLFFSACMLICLFYIHWFAVSLCSAKLPSFAESLEEDYAHAGLRKSVDAPDSAQSGPAEASSLVKASSPGASISPQRM